MKQIKTIMKRAGDWPQFDEEVNKAIAEGWTLVKRDVLRPYEGACGGVYFRMLYAELEREIVAELEREIVAEKQSEPKERRCGNCANYGTPCYDYPCTCCTDADKWEPET